jgi:hypothetical protein
MEGEIQLKISAKTTVKSTEYRNKPNSTQTEWSFRVVNELLVLGYTVPILSNRRLIFKPMELCYCTVG